MAFNPALPQDHALIESGVLRSQFIALNADTQTRITSAQLDAAIGGTSNNSDSVNTLNQNANPDYSANQMQDVLNKLDELIAALRR